MFALAFIASLTFSAGHAFQPATRSFVPFSDTLRALVVFVQFRDDRSPGDVNLDARGWPLSDDPRQLPGFAAGLLAPSPDPPYPDSSLTAYFHQQSEGRFLIWGDVVDSVLVTRHDEDHYHRPRGGYGDLTIEVLERLDAAGVDFRQYDANGDGFLDHLFILLRRDSLRDAKRFAWTGISCLDARCGPGPPAGPHRAPPVHDDIIVDWDRSGSILINRTPGNLLPHWYTVRLMAHELGHDLWAPFFTHIPPLSANDVPARSNRSTGTRSLGYVLMAGAGGGADCRGNETVSAFERDLLGWISCPILDADTTGVRLGDLYTTGACRRLTLATPHSTRTVYLSNLQRIGPFDRLRWAGRHPRYDAGLLRTTGLLVSLAEGVRFDVLPADNTLDLSPRNADYDGDLYTPDDAPQITPWTRPSLDGYTLYPNGYVPSWQAIDRLRPGEEGDGTLVFDYFRDFRLHPVIRRDSWIGAETAGYTFRGPFRVTGRSTLRLGADVTFAGPLRLEAGTTTVIEPGATVRLSDIAVLDLRAGARLTVHGTLILDGWVRRSPWSRIQAEGAGRIVAGGQPRVRR